MDYEGMVAAGTMLGSGGVIVFDDAQSMVKQIARLARFYAHESCAQCSQCREGTAWTTRILERIAPATARARTSTPCCRSAENMTGKTICVLSDSCATPVTSGLKKFRGEFEAKIPDRSRGVVPRHAHLQPGGRVSETTGPKMVTLTIEGRTVSRARRHLDPRGGQDGRRAHSALLLSPRAAGGRRVPHVPGGSGEDSPSSRRPAPPR
jgi:hypothetical protein